MFGLFRWRKGNRRKDANTVRLLAQSIKQTQHHDAESPDNPGRDQKEEIQQRAIQALMPANVTESIIEAIELSVCENPNAKSFNAEPMYVEAAKAAGLDWANSDVRLGAKRAFYTAFHERGFECGRGAGNFTVYW